MVPDGMGVKTTVTMSIITVIGSTDENASIIFAFNILFMGLPELYTVSCTEYKGRQNAVLQLKWKCAAYH